MPFYNKKPLKLDISVNIFKKRHIFGNMKKIQVDDQFKSVQSRRYCVVLCIFIG